MITNLVNIHQTEYQLINYILDYQLLIQLLINESNIY